MMEWTSIFASIFLLLGSCYNGASQYLNIGEIEIEPVIGSEGEITTIACQAGLNNTDAVYWLSIRYRRFISKNDILFDYGADWDYFDISVDDVNRIYYLHVYIASEEVSGIYMCYSSITGFDKQVLWAGEVTVLPGIDVTSLLEGSVPETPIEVNPAHSLECSASYIPPMMNMINMNEVEMEVGCIWSAVDYPGASPTLFCNGNQLLSKYFVGEMVTARVMLKDSWECFNFTCALKVQFGDNPFKETCSYLQEKQSGLAQTLRLGARIDPMYSVIQQGMDAMFVCIASSEAPQGTFRWNVSSRLFDTEDLMNNMEITKSSKASTMLIKDVQTLTDEPVLVRCDFITDNQRKKMMSEAFLTIIPQMAGTSNKTSTPVPDKPYGTQTVLLLVGLVLALLGITFCFTIYVCKSKKCCNTTATPTEGSNNNDNQKMSMYVSMKGIWERNVTRITRRARQPLPARTPPGNIPPRPSHNLPVIRIDVSSLKANPVICIDDDDYIVPDMAQDGRPPIVLRARNPRRSEGLYSSTDVMVGSRELLSSRSSQGDLTDRDGYLVPSMVIDQDLEEYVYATSDGTDGNTGEQRKSSSCHELSHYSYASYQ